MKNILVDLYHGNDTSFEGNYGSSPAYQAAAAHRENLEMELRRALPEDQKAAFDEYTMAFYKMNDLCGEQDFIAGYRFGVQMMIAALPPLNSNI